MPEQTLFDSPAPVKEEWKPIAGWEPFEVSNRGIARNRHTGKIFCLGHNPCGYKAITFTHQRGRFRKLAHCVVMQAFVGPKPDGCQINHKNGDKADNRLENLEYCTQSENIRHAMKLGLLVHRNGENLTQSKLTEFVVRVCRRCVERKIQMRWLAGVFGMSFAAIQALASRKTWKHVHHPNDANVNQPENQTIRNFANATVRSMP